jgi:DNA polymerase-3 subunit epsilon
MEARELLFAYDTETTGIPNHNEPRGDPNQPHIVQLACAVFDPLTRLTKESFCAIIKPDGWTIPDDVAAVHGITTERALDEGRPAREVLDRFLELWKKDNQILRRLAHNQNFDARMVRIAMHRHGYNDMDHVLWKGGPALCTATMSKPILKMEATAKMKAAGFNTSKTPKLSEAYEYFTQKTLEGAHDAMNDVNACIAVYFGVQDYLEANKKEVA